ncbi:MAG TPA: diguanylate cyclase [Vicinamibacteria bacterium]|nr:diguanylate cyclase [Vicinamibacteria bacterium]
MSAPRILVADDSPLVLRMIERMLLGAGYAVITAKDGLEAVEKAMAEDVSLVILDVMMPRMNGYQACRMLKAEASTRDLPVVILTSKDQVGDRAWGLETGADYYITKDAEPQQILALVKNVLATEAPRPRPASAQRTSADILSRVNELLDHKLYEATILSEIGRVARSLVQVDATFTSVMEILARVVDFTVGAIAFVEDEDLEVALLQHRNAAPPVLEEAKARLLEALRREHPPAFERIRARLFTPASGPIGAEETTLGGFAAFPMATHGSLVGLLAIAGKNVARMTKESEAFLGQAANQAFIVMQNSRLFERIKNLSVRDSLTDLFNHRHSMEILANEFARVGRYEEGFAVLMIDIDHFKEVNDLYGHPIGDSVLREVSRILRDTFRQVDAIGRYGGEEFIVVLPHSSPADALRTADRIRGRVEQHEFRAAGSALKITISVGVANYPAEGVEGPSDMVRLADQALYRAKQAGRNQVA